MTAYFFCRLEDGSTLKVAAGIKPIDRRADLPWNQSIQSQQI
jgi:hypothetical protein